MDLVLPSRRFHKRTLLLVSLVTVLIVTYEFKFSIKVKLHVHKINKVTPQPRFWTRISDDVHVFSAFLDDRGPENVHIKIMGIKRMKRGVGNSSRPLVQDITKVKDVSDIQAKYQCKLYYYEKNGDFVSVRSNKLTYFVFEEGVKEFAGVFYKCFFPQSVLLNYKRSFEIYVSLYPTNVSGYPEKLVWIQRKRTESNLSVCVRPLFGPMEDVAALAQFLSYYEAMGVGRFTFYDLSIGPRALEYLQMLSKTTQIFKWNVPTGNSSELWDYGTLTALNDCIYQTSGFAIVVDMDEFIIPQLNESILDLVSNRNFQNSNQLLLRNSFFCREWCEQEEFHLKDLLIFVCPLRTKRIWGVNHRSKYIARADRVVSVGHHFVTSYLNGSDPRYSSQTAHVLPSVALLGHFRKCGPITGKKRPISSLTSVRDERLLHFRARMEQTHSYQVYKSNYKSH